MNLQSILLKIKHYLTISRSIYILNVFLVLFFLWSAGVVGARVVENEFLQAPAQIEKFARETVDKRGKKVPLRDFKSVLDENVFDAEVSSLKPVINRPEDMNQPEVKNELKNVLKKLKLTGVLYSRKAGKFCIIKEKGSRKEDIFTIDDEVFETGLSITKIIANLSKPQVYLVMDGKTGILEYEEDQEILTDYKNRKLPVPGGRNKYTKNGKDYNIPKGELKNYMQNFGKLLTQAKVSPYSRHGKSLGYQFRHVKKGSIFEKLGIKKKDIIKKVNGEELKGAKIMELYRLLEHEKEFTVELERNGRLIALNYNIY